MVDKETEQLEAAILTGMASLSLEDSIVELKQLKAKAKSHFTKLRRCLLVSLQEQTVEIENINTLCEQLDDVEGEVLDIMSKLSDRYREQKNSEMCIKVSKEIEQIEQEYTSAQNRAQEVLDRKLLELRPAYQQEDRDFQNHKKHSQSASDKWPSEAAVSGNRNQLLAGNSILSGGSEADLIGQDLWKQLKRVSIPTFSGNKQTYQNWKAAFMACIDRAPATAEYKLLQLRQCLSGEALRAIESLGYSPTAYEAAKERLERKFGGDRRQIALYLEEIDSFRPVRSGNSKELEKFADLLDVALVNLKEANRHEELRDGLLYMKLQKKLPAVMLTNYHRWVFENRKEESVELLREWVIQEAEFQARALETVQGLTSRVEGKAGFRGSSHTFFGRSSSGGKIESQVGNRTCRLCNKSHGVWACNEFKELTVPRRWDCAKKLKLCFRCLGEGHLGQHCHRSRVCGINGCQEFHHRLLHVIEPQSSGGSGREEKQSKLQDKPQKKPEQEATVTVTQKHMVTSKDGAEQVQTQGEGDATLLSKTYGSVALRTVPVYLINSNRKLKVNALLDDASTKTYINADVAAELGLQGQPQRVTVSVLNGQVETFETCPIECAIQSLDGKSSYHITAFTTKKVTGNMSVVDWNSCAKEWSHLKGLHFPKMGPRPIVDILIGLDCADLHYSYRDIRGKPGQPIARLTPLGWTCVGALYSPHQPGLSTQFARTYFTSNHMGEESVDVVLRRFWEVDSSGVQSLPLMTAEDKMVLDKVQNSIQFVDGHYQVAIPWREVGFSIPNNYKMAVERLQKLEKRLQNNPEVAMAYDESIRKHIQKGYVKRVEFFTEQPAVKWYLPHFPVIRMDRTTTKTRVVFDASAKYNGVSLNDLIYCGPKLQQELFDVLLRFRRYPIAIVCDITEMYLQIMLSPTDRSYHRFLWKNLENENEICEYEFTRLVFGVNVSPFLAQFVIRHHAQKLQENYGRATETVLQSTYMDDSMDSVVNEKEGISLYRQLSELWEKAGMHAHKWLSNSQEVLDAVPPQDRASQLELDENGSLAVKTLGIIWKANEDVFTFKSKPIESYFKPTKRNVLKKVATLFDPLGFLSPFTITAKILMQEMWVVGVDWDDPLPSDVVRKVNSWFTELEQLPNVKIPRSLQEKHNVIKVSLHTFVDASQAAYGAVVYQRIEYEGHRLSVRLVTAKTKVAPIQSVSIPRLELMGACLGNKLTQSIIEVFSIPVQDVVFWSDSTNVLWWIRGHSRGFKPFVANRIGEIQSSTNPSQWRYVPTQLNPADHLTRGLSVRELIEQKSWWQGPQYLQDEEHNWPENKLPQISEQAKQEVKRRYCELNNQLGLTDKRDLEVSSSDDSTMVVMDIPSQSWAWRLDPECFSDWSRLIRVYSWVTRFVNNCRVNKDHRWKGELTIEEIQDSEKSIIKKAQIVAFQKEYLALSKGKSLPSGSKLLGLCPRLDEDGLMRSDSRLQYAEFLPNDVRFPIILPRKNRVTKLLVKMHHEHGKHSAGTNQTLCSLSTRYWIVAAREEILEWEKECAACLRKKAQCARQVMAPLPLCRLQPSLRAFTRTAVDFAGPFMTVQGRGKQRCKRYLCLFTCLASRAVHLELAYGLDTDSFLRAFDRMCNRRGVPEEMMSDNGTNFVGANKELRELRHRFLQNGNLERSMGDRGIKWNFNPPSAPHFGGVYETMIKAAKRAIFAILQNADVNDEELLTAFTGAESLINSRPLTYQTANPNDTVPLTPNHFLIGQIGGRFAPEIDMETNYNPRKRWRRIQELIAHFWGRWMREWVPSLSCRKKWYKSQKNLEEGDIVMIISPESPRAHWPLGKVIEVYPGQDGYVRSVKLQVGEKQLVRPIVKLCPLELD